MIEGKNYGSGGGDRDAAVDIEPVRRGGVMCHIFPFAPFPYCAKLQLEMREGGGAGGQVGGVEGGGGGVGGAGRRVVCIISRQQL